MHAKSCGMVYVCGTCPVGVCSLSALKRHCKHFGHEMPSMPQPLKEGELHEMPSQPQPVETND